MLGLTSSNVTPQESSFDFMNNLDDYPCEMNFQSKNFQDSFVLIDNEKSSEKNKSRNQKKFNFNPLVWTLEDQSKLIDLHKKIGNKWTSLSKYFPGSCQNFIKNHFYSRLRKSIRKLNKTISTLFGKKYTKFNLNIIFKLSNVSEGKVMGKCHVEMEITTFYKDFIYKLIDFSENGQESVEWDRNQLIEEVQDFILGLIALENLFRIISGERVYKGKKKNIAYLKRFHFKLDTQSKKTLVISKENVYISDVPIDSQMLSERSSESINSLEGGNQNDVDHIDQLKQKIFNEKTEEKTISFELCQKNFANESSQHTNETQLEHSPYQSFLLDEELREYELPVITMEKGTYFDNLLDQYSGNKFHFDIEG